MTFTSIYFPIYLILIFYIYWLSKSEYRKYILLVGGLIFYGLSCIWYPILLLYVVVLSYLISKTNRLHWTVYVSMIIFPLFVFKYAGLFSNIVNQINGADFDTLVLPIGLSFYTFSALSYVIECKKGKESYSLLDLGVGLTFFPCLISGPIERPHRLIPQLTCDKKFDYESAEYGLKRIAIGYFKKLVIADTLAKYVNQIYGNVYETTGFALVIGMFFYSIEIYADFSGYSDIAIGVARLFCVDLKENFRQPYFAKSIKDFWSRWHISLSSWLKDYIYIPLGGNRKGIRRKYLNIMVTFFISGGWHGSDITYILWGICHGASEIVEDTFSRKRRADNWIVNSLKMMTTFIVVSVFWVFFRAETIGGAVHLLTHMFDGIKSLKSYLILGIHYAGLSKYSLLVTLVDILLLFIYDVFSINRDLSKQIECLKWYIRWPLYILFILSIVIMSSKGTGQQFVYGEF